MGKRGPKPTPTAALKLAGSWRADKRGKQGEVTPPVGLIKKPTYLKGPAARKFKQLSGLLEEMGILGTTDTEALSRYCDTWAWWLKLRKFLQDNGETYTTEKIKRDGGSEYITLHVAQRPEVNIILKIATQLSKLESEFGLTPSARVGLVSTKSPNSKNTKKHNYFNKASSA